MMFKGLNLRINVVLAILFFSFGFLCDTAFAIHPLITDDTGTQGKGKAQIELNAEFPYDREDEDGVKVKKTGAEITALVSYGLWDNADLVLALPYKRHKETEDGIKRSDEKGPSDLSIELKWRFYQTEDNWSFAFKPMLTLPTGDYEKGLGAGKVTGGLFLISTTKKDPFFFHFNLGYVYNNNRIDELKHLWHISAAAELELKNDLKIVGNLGLQKNPERSSDNTLAFAIGGLIYAISESIDIDFGIKTGLTKSATDLAVLTGITMRF